ncbi:uncharacterized protein F5Z01DRAFT_668290 [Emericellopsis atlantica]|uniref:Rhodopsin domain-containing protein n=1 Tax=Emericellopsis atlantica TaxID=2614577 RepID=A0A9P7ZCN6_9HYPO|nr:uncharacterized protein F5Z01DRAFT_668290 [Emericellopsis atlantica]KAG9249758.1 hypothetical protein F5Z01DRAFT_668290 [Emericellopsis atlantica]
MSDPLVTQAIADGRVPPGITAQYLNQSKDASAIVGIIFVTIFASCVVAVRLFSRAFLLHRFGLDDCLTVASWVLFIPFVGLCIKLIRLGSGRHFDYIQYVLDMPTIQRTEVLDFVAHILYTTSLLLCRLSGLAFYHRLCSVNPRFLLAIKIVFAIMIIGYISQLFLIILHCIPVTGLWPYTFQPDYDKYRCLQWGLVYSVNSAVSLACDLFLFGIPVLMIRMLNISRKKKIQLGGILLPGILVIGISVTRLVFVIEGQWNVDMSWAYDPMLAIEVTEIGATLVALSVPGVKPFIDKFVLRRNILSEDDTKGHSRYGDQSTSQRGDIALHSLNLRSAYDGRQDHLRENEHEASAQGFGNFRTRNKFGDDQSDNSVNGILIHVDFQVKEVSARRESNAHAASQASSSTS